VPPHGLAQPLQHLHFPFTKWSPSVRRQLQTHSSTEIIHVCAILCVSARPSPTEAQRWWCEVCPTPLKIQVMPSRQECRKAGRDAAKRAPSQAGAAGAGGAGGAATPRANLNMNPVGDWTTQAEDPWLLLETLGDEVVKRKAGAGDREARFSHGSRLVSEADEAVGATNLGAGGRSRKADVGFALSPAQFPCFPVSFQDCDASPGSL